MRIVISGATGNIGSKLVPLLIDNPDTELVLTTRSAEKVAGWVEKGATAAVGSVQDPQFLLDTTKGADAFFFLIPPNYEAENPRAYQREMSRAAAAAIKTNGIGHVVTLSSVGAQHAQGAGPVSGLHDMEEIIGAAAENVVHLRPAFFMENFFMNLGTIQEAGSIFMPVRGEVSFPMIATQDIAPHAAKWLSDLSWTGQHVAELLGPRDLNFDEAAKVIGHNTGRQIQYVQVPSDAAHGAMVGMGLSTGVADELIELYSGMDAGHVTNEFDRTPDGTTPTTIEQFSLSYLKPALDA